MAKKQRARQSRQTQPGGKRGRGNAPAKGGRAAKGPKAGRTVSLVKVCRIDETTDVNITIQGRSLRLFGFGYPKSGRIREFQSAELDNGVPFAPYNSSNGNALATYPVPDYDPATGEWEMEITGETCNVEVPRDLYFVIWWYYENVSAVHLCTEAIRVHIDPCDDLRECD